MYVRMHDCTYRVICECMYVSMYKILSFLCSSFPPAEVTDSTQNHKNYFVLLPTFMLVMNIKMMCKNFARVLQDTILILTLGFYF